MNDFELDQLLQGAPGGTVVLGGPNGERMELYLPRRVLASRRLMRAALRAAGCDPPPWTSEEHADILTALFMVADLTERDGEEAA